MVEVPVYGLDWKGDPDTFALYRNPLSTMVVLVVGRDMATFYILISGDRLLSRVARKNSFKGNLEPLS